MSVAYTVQIGPQFSLRYSYGKYNPFARAINLPVQRDRQNRHSHPSMPVFAICSPFVPRSFVLGMFYSIHTGKLGAPEDNSHIVDKVIWLLLVTKLDSRILDWLGRSFPHRQGRQPHLPAPPAADMGSPWRHPPQLIRTSKPHPHTPMSFCHTPC